MVESKKSLSRTGLQRYREDLVEIGKLCIGVLPSLTELWIFLESFEPLAPCFFSFHPQSLQANGYVGKPISQGQELNVRSANHIRSLPDNFQISLRHRITLPSIPLLRLRFFRRKTFG